QVQLLVGNRVLHPRQPNRRLQGGVLRPVVVLRRGLGEVLVGQVRLEVLAGPPLVGGDPRLLRRLAEPGDGLLGEEPVVAQVGLGLDARLADRGRVPLERLLDEDQRLGLGTRRGERIGCRAKVQRGHEQERSEHPGTVRRREVQALSRAASGGAGAASAGEGQRAGSPAGAGAGSSVSPLLAVSPLRSSAVLNRIGPTSSFIATVATAIAANPAPYPGCSFWIFPAMPSASPACETSPAQPQRLRAGGSSASRLDSREANHVHPARDRVSASAAGQSCARSGRSRWAPAVAKKIT